jgi:hypothetical protein
MLAADFKVSSWSLIEPHSRFTVPVAGTGMDIWTPAATAATWTRGNRIGQHR